MAINRHVRSQGTCIEDLGRSVDSTLHFVTHQDEGGAATLQKIQPRRDEAQTSKAKA